jgi:hypothetical protein
VTVCSGSNLAAAPSAVRVPHLREANRMITSSVWLRSGEGDQSF